VVNKDWVQFANQASSNAGDSLEEQVRAGARALGVSTDDSLIQHIVTEFDSNLSVGENLCQFHACDWGHWDGVSEDTVWGAACASSWRLFGIVCGKFPECDAMGDIMQCIWRSAGGKGSWTASCWGEDEGCDLSHLDAYPITVVVQEPKPLPTPLSNWEDWQEVCVAMKEYLRDCNDKPECADSNDPRRCLLYSKDIENFVIEGQEYDLLYAQGWVRTKVQDWWQKSDGNLDIITIVAEVLTDALPKQTPGGEASQKPLEQAWQDWVSQN